MPNIIAIDGKTSRRSYKYGSKPLHTVSAFAAEQRLVLGQQACAEKSNEITAIPELLQRLHLQGALVTIDAMGCQTNIAQTIVEKGADYLLALKDNQRSLAREVEMYFADMPQKIDHHETLDADHGRIETRHCMVSPDVDWLTGSKNATGEPRFKKLSMIGMVESTVLHKASGKQSIQKRYYICSTKLSAEQFSAAVRSHWAIENSLHWVLDVVFRDDLSRLRTEHGPKNMLLIKHTAANLLRQMPYKASMAVRRKLASWDESFLRALLAYRGA